MQSDLVRQNFRNSVRILALFAVLLVVALSPVVHAQTEAASIRFRGGGEIQVAVSGQTESERSDAYRIGLRWLLQDYAKTADEQQIINHEATRQALSQPENYVDAFEYTRIPEGQAIGALPMSPSVRDSGSATHWVTLQYSIPALNELVAATREVESGEDDVSSSDDRTDRRQTSSRQALLWLLIEDQSLQLWVAPDTAANVVARLTELAGSHGYRLEFPLFDVTELALIGPETLEEPGAEEEEKLRESAARYRFTQMLAGTIKRRAAGGWQVSLIRIFDAPAEQTTDNFRSDAGTLDMALQVVTGWLSGTLDQNGRVVQSSTPAVPSGFGAGSGTAASIWIGGPIDSAAINRLQQYFAESTSVERASLSEIRADGVMYQISPRSSLASVSSDLQAQSWLELGSREDGGFTEVPPPANGSDQSGADTETSAEDANTGGQAFTTPVPEPRTPAADLYLRYVF